LREKFGYTTRACVGQLAAVPLIVAGGCVQGCGDEWRTGDRWSNACGSLRRARTTESSTSRANRF